jgi:chitodextrinase
MVPRFPTKGNAMWNAASTWVRRRTGLVLAGATLASLAVLSPVAAETKQPPSHLRVTVVAVSPTSASVSWQGPTRNRRLGQVAGYGLYLNGSRVARTNELRYMFGGLNCGTTYTLGVERYFASGRRSEVMTLTTSTARCRDTSRPSPPSGVAQTAATANAVSLAWNPSADDVGVAGYGAYRRGAKIGTTAETRYTFGNLSCGTTYRLGVDSFDAAGNRSTIVTTNASTAACGSSSPPPPPPPPHLIDVQRHIRTAGSIASWGKYDSSGGQTYGTPGNEFHGNVSWDATQRDIFGQPALYSVTRKTYMLFGFRLISGYPGRMLNGHTVPHDRPGGWSNWCTKGISPWAIDYWGDTSGLTYSPQAEKDSTCPDGGHQSVITIIPTMEMEARRGQWIWVWVETVWGHHGITPNGSTRIWVSGENTPRVALSDINTHPPGMGMLSFWTGHYHCQTCAPQADTLEMAAPRYGLTPKATYEDTPKLVTCQGAIQFPGDTPGRCEQQPPIDGNVPVPTELRW